VGVPGSCRGPCPSGKGLALPEGSDDSPNVPRQTEVPHLPGAEAPTPLHGPNFCGHKGPKRGRGQRFDRGRASGWNRRNPAAGPDVGEGQLSTHLGRSPQLSRLVATSIRTGTTTSSAMLKKLSAYPRQNGLAKALREIGRIERTLFTLDWIKNPDLRRRAHLGLNKGEARNALARAVYFCRLGEVRDRSFENQFFRASGLNLLVAAIILWNTKYLEVAYAEQRRQGGTINEDLLRHVAPLGWEHIGLTGDYVWSTADQPPAGTLRPLRQRQSLLVA
jgi:Tn3 transposase DDE domain